MSRPDGEEQRLKRWAQLARPDAFPSDPSDAGPQHYDASARGYEPLTDWPQARRTQIRTEREGWVAELPRLVAWIRTPHAEARRPSARA